MPQSCLPYHPDWQGDKVSKGFRVIHSGLRFMALFYSEEIRLIFYNYKF